MADEGKSFFRGVFALSVNDVVVRRLNYGDPTRKGGPLSIPPPGLYFGPGKNNAEWWVDRPAPAGRPMAVITGVTITPENFHLVKDHIWTVSISGGETGFEMHMYHPIESYEQIQQRQICINIEHVTPENLRDLHATVGSKEGEGYVYKDFYELWETLGRDQEGRMETPGGERE